MAATDPSGFVKKNGPTANASGDSRWPAGRSFEGAGRRWKRRADGERGSSVRAAGCGVRGDGGSSSTRAAAAAVWSTWRTVCRGRQAHLVDAHADRHGWLLDGNRLERARIRRVDDRVANVELGNARNHHNVSSRSLVHRSPPHSVVEKNLRRLDWSDGVSGA